MRRIGAVGLALLIVAACGSTGSPNPSGPARLIVVATTTVFADLVSKVGGDLVTVRSLVPKGGEVHTFDPKPGDITTVADADLIVANGLGLDDWLAALARDAGATAPIIRLGENLDGAEYIKTEGAVNPHLWMDPTLASRYVARIGEALGEADSAHADDYVQRATEVEAQFSSLDASIHQKLGTIPASERRLVSFHDAFPYFARAYGLEIVGVVVQVPGQDPSAGEVASLVDAIRTANVRLILSEVQFSPALAEQIAAETGATVVSDLYDDSLGDPPVDSYEAILNWDADKIAEALK